MKATSAVNMVIAQSGGPSMVINQSLAGVVLAARAAGPAVGRILGARHGIDGILKGDFTDLRRLPPAKVEAIAATPSSALGSCRHKPTAEDCDKILAALLARGVGYFFYIGGNDSADAARIRRSTATCSSTTTPPATAPRRASSRAPSAATTSTTARSAASRSTS